MAKAKGIAVNRNSTMEIKIPSLKSKSMLRPGFEPGSSAREAEMIGRTTLPEQKQNSRIFFIVTLI